MRGNELTITVSKRDLLRTLELNRDKHGAAFEKAKKGYIKVTMKQLQEYIQQLEDDWGWKQSWLVSNSGYLEA